MDSEVFAQSEPDHSFLVLRFDGHFDIALDFDLSLFFLFIFLFGGLLSSFDFLLFALCQENCIVLGEIHNKFVLHLFPNHFLVGLGNAISAELFKKTAIIDAVDEGGVHLTGEVGQV